LKTLDLD